MRSISTAPSGFLQLGLSQCSIYKYVSCIQCSSVSTHPQVGPTQEFKRGSKRDRNAEALPLATRSHVMQEKNTQTPAHPNSHQLAVWLSYSGLWTTIVSRLHKRALLVPHHCLDCVACLHMEGYQYTVVCHRDRQRSYAYGSVG